MTGPWYLHVSYALGSLTLAYVFVKLLIGIYARLLRPGKNLKQFGPWGMFLALLSWTALTTIFPAVVTGATDGIGKAIAFELAKKGENIVLISRSQEKLEACRTELLAKYPKVEVKILSVDYSQFNEAARAKVSSVLKDVDVGILVNNVGISYPYTKYFHELDDERVEQLITLNVESTTWMTRIVIPGACLCGCFNTNWDDPLIFRNDFQKARIHREHRIKWGPTYLVLTNVFHI